MATIAADLPIYRELTPGQRVLRRFMRRRGALVGLAVVVFFVLLALFAPWLAVPVGLLAGYTGGWADGLISRITDAMLACPFLILAIALAAFLGPSLSNAMIAIGVTATPLFVRLSRGQV